MYLRTCTVKFYKQRIIGPYIADFYCASAKLVIEIDGSQHYDIAGQDHDIKRTEYLENLGLRVLRFSNADINCRFKQVCEAIHFAIEKDD